MNADELPDICCRPPTEPGAPALRQDAARARVAQLERMRAARGPGAAADYRRLRICALPRSGTAMACFELGDPHGTPLLCLHGLSVSGLYFDQFDRFFAERGIRAIAPCLLGGISVTDSSPSLSELSAQLIELLDVVGVERFDVVGFSWGTLPQLALLAAAPARVRRAGLLGPMLPVAFLEPAEVARMKPDVRASLAMVRRMPMLHRGLMALVCRLPVSVLVGQFKDAELSTQEADALGDGTPFARHLAHCVDECRRTGSRFFTDGWRTFLDAPGFALSALASPALQADVRLYVGGRDNVHLPSFAHTIAAARCGIDVGELRLANGADAAVDADPAGPYRAVFAAPGCSLWSAAGSGRLACILHLRQAIEHLVASDAAGGAAPTVR